MADIEKEKGISDVHMTDDRKEQIEHWKTVISTQMHFNDMILRTRTLGVSVVIGVFGAAAALASRSPEPTIKLCGVLYNAGALVVLFGLGLLFSVFLLDYFYYYKLLIASVERGEQLEQEISGPKAQGTVHRFSLSLLLSDRVSRKRAKCVIFGFYGIPLLVGLAFGWIIIRS